MRMQGNTKQTSRAGTTCPGPATVSPGAAHVGPLLLERSCGGQDWELVARNVWLPSLSRLRTRDRLVDPVASGSSTGLPPTTKAAE